MVFRYLKGSYKEDRDPLLAVSHMKKRKDYRYRPGKVSSQHKKEIFTERIIIYRNNLLRGVIEPLWLKVFKIQLDSMINNLIFFEIWNYFQ